MDYRKIFPKILKKLQKKQALLQGNRTACFSTYFILGTFFNDLGISLFISA